MTHSSSTAMVAMPDIAQQAHTEPQGVLSWVGMHRIHQPVRLAHSGAEQRVQAAVDVYVDLTDPHAKGIHMSRLYLHLDQHARQHTLSPASLKMLLNTMLQTHHDISGSARVRFEIELVMEREALRSANTGWSSYPVSIDAMLDNGAYTFELGLEILYSSTCPCSAALARQLIQRSFDESFDPSQPISFDAVRAWLGTPQGIVATPHSQRSVAQIRVKLDEDATTFPIEALINTLENALATPVQTAVKREDEQEFALRNGQNLMFCEDAARKLKQALDASPSYLDYWLRVEHQESLHAHDAVAIAVKGVDGGFTRL